MGHRNRAEINQHSARGSDQFIEICWFSIIPGTVDDS